MHRMYIASPSYLFQSELLGDCFPSLLCLFWDSLDGSVDHRHPLLHRKGCGYMYMYVHVLNKYVCVYVCECAAWPARPLSPSPDYYFELCIMNRRGGVDLADQTCVRVTMYMYMSVLVHGITLVIVVYM